MKYYAAFLLCCTVCCSITGDSRINQNNSEKTPLKFSYITTKTGGVTGFVSSGSIPVVDLALEQINNRTDILSDYVLKYTTILDTNVSSSSSGHYF